MRGELATLLLAVQFLTRLPVRSDGIFTPQRMAASVRYYPLVGLGVGGLSAAVYVVATLTFPPMVALLLAIATGLIVTGAFHEDGLADTFDGVGGGLTRDKALSIMRDSRLGTYGSLALIIALTVKIFALNSLPMHLVPYALIVGHGVSRLSSVLVIATSRYVRDEGTGKPVSNGISFPSQLVSIATGLIAVALWCIWLSPMAVFCALIGVFVGHVLMRLLFEPKLGGYTGDTLGAVQQVSEIGFYLGLVAWF